MTFLDQLKTNRLSKHLGILSLWFKAFYGEEITHNSSHLYDVIISVCMGHVLLSNHFNCGGNIEQLSMFLYFYFHNKTNLSDIKKDCANSPSFSLTHSLYLSAIKNQCSCYISALLPWGIDFVKFILFLPVTCLDVFQCALVTFSDIYELSAFVFCDDCAIICFST